MKRGATLTLPRALRKGIDVDSTMLVVDPSLKGMDAARRLRDGLHGEQVRFVLFDSFSSNPTCGAALEAAKLARAEKVRSVIALGGGSALDLGKAAAMLATNPGRPVADFVGRDKYLAPPLPFMCVPTTCGTGSEVTWVSVLTDVDARTKVSIKGEAMYPDYAFVDPDLLVTLPPHIVSATALDALTHAIEATTCKQANWVSDSLAERAIRSIFEFLPRAYADIKGDAEAREKVMHASTLAGMAFGNADVAGVHCLSETIGGLYGAPHGILNASLLPPVLRYHLPAIQGRLSTLLDVLPPPVGEVSFSERESDEIRAQKFLDLLEQLLETVNIPKFKRVGQDLGLMADFESIAEGAVKNNSNESNPQDMGIDDYIKILEQATE